MFRSLLFVMVSASLFSIAGSAQAGCVVVWKYSGGKTFRAMKCDDTDVALTDAITFAVESCPSLDGALVDACYDAIVTSFELRRQAMLRRTLKEGATVEAPALLYGYTEDEVTEWAAAKELLVDLYSDESREPSPAVLEGDRALEDLLATLGLSR